MAVPTATTTAGLADRSQIGTDRDRSVVGASTIGLIFIAASFRAGGATPIGRSAVPIRKFDRRPGRAPGLAFMGAGLGGAVLPPLSARLVAEFGWRWAYAGLGALALALVRTVPAVLVATRGAGGPVRARTTAAAPPMLFLPRSRALVLICAIFLLLGTTSIGTLTSLVPMMIGRGFSPQAAARLTGLTGAVLAVLLAPSCRSHPLPNAMDDRPL